MGLFGLRRGSVWQLCPKVLTPSMKLVAKTMSCAACYVSIYTGTTPMLKISGFTVTGALELSTGTHHQNAKSCNIWQ